MCELCELWSGEGGICVSGVGFWLLRMRPKRAAGVSQATGGVGVLGSWFRKKVLQTVVRRKRSDGSLGESM